MSRVLRDGVVRPFLQVEADPAKREELAKAALREFEEQVHVIPLHRQVIPWAACTNVDVVHRPDSGFEVQWVKLNPR